MSKPVATIVLAVAALAGGAAGGYWYASRQAQDDMVRAPAPQKSERKPLFYRNPMNPEITSPVPAKDEMGMDYIAVYAEAEKPGGDTDRKALFYRNPMNPEITSPVPAKDEMGMDYIPVYADGGADGDEPPGTVMIDPVIMQNIGVRTARAEHRTLSRAVRTVGRVDYNEELIARMHPKVEGWIETLFIDRTGARIKRDAILLDLYSPQLVTSQQEYLLALKAVEVLERSGFEDIRRGAVELAASARQRLEHLDVPEHQIRELEESRQVKKTLHIHSPFDGVVVRIGARDGQYVTPQTELYMIADLSRIWVLADVYEDELPWVAEGDPARLTVPGLPGEVFEGRVDYVYPYLDERTRTVQVRLEFDNPDLALKPDMFANVELLGDRRVDAVAVPAEAIVRSGERERVFVVRAPGKFEPREVRLGVSSSGWTQILAGVQPGEEVVTSAQFLIDSESKLREATAKMLEATAAKAQSAASASRATQQPSGTHGDHAAAPAVLDASPAQAHSAHGGEEGNAADPAGARAHD